MILPGVRASGLHLARLASSVFMIGVGLIFVVAALKAVGEWIWSVWR